jgi:hypothetical protein
MLFIKKLLIIIIYILIIPSCVAKPEQYSSTTAKPLFDEIKKLHDSSKWQQFVTQRELIDINYDLYRVKGPNDNDKVISGQDPKNYFIDKHNDMFCSKISDANCRAQLGHAYGDIKFSYLFNNIYKNPDELHLATEVTRNIINPFPSNFALEMKAATNYDKSLPKNKAALAELYASQARLGVVRNSFNTMLRNRVPLGVLEGNMPGSEQNSMQSIIEKESQNRFTSSVWHEEINNSNQEQLLKELVKMEAFKTWVDYHRYKQNERIEALLATMVAQQETLTQLLNNNNVKNN